MIYKILSLIILLVRRIVYGALYFVRPILPQNKVVILCYHSVSNNSWRFGVDFETLKQQIENMLRVYHPVKLEDIEQFVKGNITFDRPVFAVTFDDGYTDIYQTKEYFASKNIYPAVFVLSDTSKAKADQLGAKNTFLDTSLIRDLATHGWTIGCHSATHSDFYSLDDNLIKDEVVVAKHDLEKQIGLPINYFAYPKGRYTEKILTAVDDAGYLAAFSMDDRIIEPGDDVRTIARVGVDRTHTLLESQATISTGAVKLRSIVKDAIKWFETRGGAYGKA
jgi:biofilm PGA synthesis lipoprotein PgaB